MTRLRQGAPRRPRTDVIHVEPEPPKHGPRRGEDFHTILDAIDAALARRDDSDDARVALIQTYATIWAAIGYGIWVVLELLIRILLAIVRFISRRGGRDDDDDQWTTTMKKKGRVR